MSFPVAPQAVTVYDIVKDFGFPAAVALILLFQINPRLDAVASANNQVAVQLAVLNASCTARSGA